jgi:hypothetical protein
MPGSRTRYRIFVSYSRKDFALVNPLVRLLMVADNRLFQDVRDIEPGRRWRAVITMAVKSCDKMLLFWCAHSSNSLEVEREYAGAIEHRKILVPVLLDDTRLPNRLTEYQAVDLRQALGTHREGRIAAASGVRANRRDDVFPGETELAVMLPDADALQSAAAQLHAELGASWGR